MTPVTTKLEAAFGADPDGDIIDWTWTDLTSRHLHDPTAVVRRGRADESASLQAASLTVDLHNDDGALTPLQASSPYYPNVRRGTPIRFSVAGADAALVCTAAATAAASTPDHASLDITGDIDIRAEADLPFWDGCLLQKGDPGTANACAYMLSVSDGFLILRWDPVAAGILFDTSTVAVPKMVGRQAVRATLDVDNGSGGHTVTFYTSDSIDGSWTQLGDAVVTAGTTNVQATTAVLDLGGVLGTTQPYGRILAAEVRNGIGGSVVADPDFTGLAEGTTSFADSTGKTWTVGADASVSLFRARFIGHAAEWSPTWPSLDTNGARVKLTAAGTLRRLRQGTPPLESPIRRVISRKLRTNTGVLGYWPLEDESDATSGGGFAGIATPAPVVGPMIASGTTPSDVSFAADSTIVGSEAVAHIAQGTYPTDYGSLYGTITLAADPSSWAVEAIVYVESAPSTASTIFQVFSSGTVSRWTLQIDGTNFGLSGEGLALDTEPITEFYGQWCRLRLTVADDGANVDYTVSWSPITDGTANSFSGTFAGTQGRPSAVELMAIGCPDGASFGHCTVQTPQTWTWLGDSVSGHVGETAGERIERLCTEEGITLHWEGDLSDTEPMGEQEAGALVDLLAEAAEADMGILYELREVPGFGYRTRASLYNQAAALTVDASSDRLVNPFEPVLDDQRLRNDVTVSRTGGSSHQALDATSIDDEGRYDDTVAVNVQTDTQLGDQAAWRLHLGTWPDMRYPAVPVQLRDASDAVVESWLDLDIGDRVEVTDLPAEHPADAVSLLVQGYSEAVSLVSWQPSINGSPAGPYTVGVIDDDTPSTALARLDSDGSTLSTGIDDNDTSLSVATPSGPLWTTSASYMPMDIFIAGEQMTVTAISGASSPQTFTVTRSVNGVVKSHSSGAALSLADPFVLTL